MIIITEEQRERASKYITLTGDNEVDEVLIAQLELSRQLVEKKKANDNISMTLTQAWQYNLIASFSMGALQHFLKLRLKQDAHWDIQELAQKLYKAIPEEHKYLFEHCIKEPTEVSISKEEYDKLLEFKFMYESCSK